MRRRRIIHRSDANQADVVAFARSVGATVDVIGEPLDLLVGWKGQNLLWEVKADAKAALRPSQAAFFLSWKGQRQRINSVADAAAALGIVHSPVQRAPVAGVASNGVARAHGALKAGIRSQNEETGARIGAGSRKARPGIPGDDP